MIYTVEWKRSFSALKSFKIGFIWLPLNIPFLEKSVWLTYLDIFSHVGLKSGMWKTASLLSSCIPGFLL